jgi:hypothetical protein
MTRPPRTAEFLLQSLGARPSFCEPLLGDLAEEFVARAERDGEPSARLWYYREVMRAVPHLLRDWVRSMRLADVRYFGGVILSSFIFTQILIVLPAVLAERVAETFGISLLVGVTPVPQLRIIAMMLPILFLPTILGGYIAAWLGARAPLASAIVFGLTWSVAAFAVGVIDDVNMAPAWFVIVVVLLQVSGPTLGGLLRVRVLARRV